MIKNITHMNLLYGLTGRVLLASSNSVIEDYYFLDTRDLVSEHVLYFLVVPLSYSLIVGEQFFLGRIVVDRESGVVGSELMLSPSQIMDLSAVVLLLKVVARTVHLRPGFSLVASGINVLEVCRSHFEC
jgi:hypothetical protein